MTVPFFNRSGGDYWTEDDEVLIWREYASLMSDPDIMKINQNIVGFDAPFLFTQCNIHTKGKLGDPMIAQHIMYPDFNKGLDFIASIHTREPYWKDDGKIWKNPNIDWDTFQRYCARDACVALEAWDVLSAEMTAGGYWPTYNMTVRMADPLTYMTAHGLAVDREGLANTKARLEASIASKEAELVASSQWDFNPTSPKQCQQYFYDTLGLPPYKNQMGGITTDDKAMSRIVRKAGVGAKEAKLVQEIRALKKLKGTYIDVELDPDGRLRCAWNPRGTWTGRLSSSHRLHSGTGMSLQNLHPEFKEFIVAG
jgi:DNA polymerase I - 3''-5'' exonuclease and polymerase domains